MITFALLGTMAMLSSCSTIAANVGGDIHETVHQSTAVSHSIRLHLENVAGNVRIDTWNQPRVDITATKNAENDADLKRVHIDTHLDGDTLTVETKYDDDGGNHHSGSVDYVVHVPAMLAVAVNDVAGSISATGLESDASLSATAGNVDATFAKIADNRTIEISATAGRITVHIPKNSNATVHADSTVGNITTNLPISVVRHDFVGVSANGTLGSGSARIDLSATAGSISLLSAP